MHKICSAEYIRECDRLAMQIYGIGSIVLMENAASAVVDAVGSEYNIQGLNAAVFCGAGNNGGDGFAVARRLSIKGANVSVFVMPGVAPKGDALINCKILEKMDIPISDASADLELMHFDVVIDAIFGTGLSRDVEGEISDIIDNINQNARYIMSVDIPSGVDANTGKILGNCIRAHETVTFLAYKRCMFLFDGCEACGRVTVADISIPSELLDRCDISLTDREFVCDIIKKRKRNTHKGDYGKLLIIAGSEGLTGAAAMSANSAVRMGAGLVTVGICKALNPVLEAKLTEPMTLALKDTDGHLSREAYAAISEKMKKSTAVLFGPGLGRSDDVAYLLKMILSEAEIPVIIDADGIAVLSREDITNSKCSVILTPHTGEMSALSGLSCEYIEENRIDVSRAVAEELGACVILKGCHTIVTGANGKQYINNTGNPGMATGGSGDVLAGMVAALVARGTQEEYASAAAVYLHGVAGDIAREKFGEEAMRPTDIIDCICDAVASCM